VLRILVHSSLHTILVALLAVVAKSIQNTCVCVAVQQTDHKTTPVHDTRRLSQTRRFLRDALGSAGAQAPCWGAGPFTGTA